LLVSRITQKYWIVFHQFVGKVLHGPRKKRLDFGGNLDHVTLEVSWVMAPPVRIVRRYQARVY